MSFDAWFRFLFLAVLACLFAYLARALWTGRLRAKGRIWLRDEAPADYWFEFAMMLLFSLLVFWAAVIQPLLRPQQDALFLGGALLAAVASDSFLRSLRSRSADFFHEPLHRAERLGPYWTLTLAQLAVAVAGVTIMFVY